MGIYNDVDDFASSIVDVCSCTVCLKSIFSKNVSREDKLEYRKNLKETLKDSTIVKAIDWAGIAVTRIPLPFGTILIEGVSALVGAYEITAYFVNDIKYSCLKSIYKKQCNYTKAKQASDNYIKNENYIKKAVPMACTIAAIKDYGICALQKKIAQKEADKNVFYEYSNEYINANAMYSELRDNFINDLSEGNIELFPELVKSTKNLIENIGRHEKDNKYKSEKSTKTSFLGSDNSEKMCVDTEALAQMINSIRDYMTSEEDSFSKLSAAFNSVNSHWDDKHSEAFKEILIIIRRSINSSLESCNETIKRLQYKIHLIEEYERS